MRITNKMMSNNSQVNINTNKALLDKLNTEVSTQKKITRPSDDPVVAIRALRLRSNLNEISQYYKKNIPDADSWLKVTETALEETESVIEDMYEYCTQGSNGDLTAEDRLKVLENLKELRNQVYSAGNADYAGRTVFTGYRTGESLTYTKDTTQTFSITEGFNADDVTSKQYVSEAVSTTPISTIASADFPESNEVYRIRLSYDNLDAAVPTSIQYKVEIAGATVVKNAANPVFEISANGTDYDITDNGDGTFTSEVSGSAQGTFIRNQDGTYTLTDGSATVNLNSTGSLKNAYLTNSITVNAASVSDAGYLTVAAGAANYIAETGELILSDIAKNILQSREDIVGTDTITVTYEKSNWTEGDLQPIHYFNCTDVTNSVTYEKPSDGQTIEYDISFNQSLKVNTLAEEVFTHDIVRDVDELAEATQAVVDIESKIASLESMQKDSQYTDAEQESIATMLEAAEKEYTLAKENMKELFQNAITKTQGYLDDVNLAIANCGSRSARLELTQARMKEQFTSFTELASENENVDVTEVAIELASAELAYDAALLATGKIAQQTLLNYL